MLKQTPPAFVTSSTTRLRILTACGHDRRLEQLERARLCLITNPAVSADSSMLNRVEAALLAG